MDSVLIITVIIFTHLLFKISCFFFLFLFCFLNFSVERLVLGNVNKIGAIPQLSKKKKKVIILITFCELKTFMQCGIVFKVQTLGPDYLGLTHGSFSL